MRILLILGAVSLLDISESVPIVDITTPSPNHTHFLMVNFSLINYCYSKPLHIIYLVLSSSESDMDRQGD